MQRSPVPNAAGPATYTAAKDCASSRRRIAKMNIDEAARATRGYFVMPGQEGDPDGLYVLHEDDSSVEMRFSSYDEAQAACDRMNLRAVLEAIRDASLDSHRRAVLDAIIAEVGK